MKYPIPDVRNSQCIDVFEVASPNSAQTSSTGDPGVSASARVDAPEVSTRRENDNENQILSPSSAEGLEVRPVPENGDRCGLEQIFYRPTQPVLGVNQERGIVMVETREAHNLEVAGSNPAPAINFSHSLGFDKPTLIEQMCGVIVDENLALALDEGQNASNAWRLHEHVNNGLKTLVERTEGILTRAKVEPELAEVSR